MQLPLFDSVTDGVNSLIDALNMGSKPKDLYFAMEVKKVSNTCYLAIAMNKEKSVIFNVVDQNGNVPNGCSSCWRIWQHITKELKISISDLDNFEVHSVGAITKNL